MLKLKKHLAGKGTFWNFIASLTGDKSPKDENFNILLTDDI